MRIALGQINPTVGDLAGNRDLMTRFAVRAAEAGAGLIVFPELSLTGYPLRDLVEKPTLLERVEQALQELAGATSGLNTSSQRTLRESYRQRLRRLRDLVEAMDAA